MEFRHTLLFALLGAVMLCCGCGSAQGSSPLRVLDAATGEPVEGVEVVAVVPGWFGAPAFTKGVKTDREGRVLLPYPRKRMFWQVELRHPEFRQVYPKDVPWEDGGEALRYVRHPPRVIVEVPQGFSGPVLVIAGKRDFDYEQEVFRVAMADDPSEPTALPGLGHIMRSEEFEVERAGVRVMPASEGRAAGAALVWVARDGLSYEEQYVDVLFIGTKEQLASFNAALHAALLKLEPGRTLDRETFGRLRDVR